MCGRYHIKISENELSKIIEAAKDATGSHSGECSSSFSGGEVLPGNLAPVITYNNKACFMKWGFPSILESKAPHINARSETAANARTFSEAMTARRCIIPASAYYEWKAPDKKQKIKYEFTLQDRTLLYMAGIYSKDWRFAVLTRASTPEIAEIHDRMPVILPKSLISHWLNESPDVIDKALCDLKYAPIPASDKQPRQINLQATEEYGRQGYNPASSKARKAYEMRTRQLKLDFYSDLQNREHEIQG